MKRVAGQSSSSTHANDGFPLLQNKCVNIQGQLWAGMHQGVHTAAMCVDELVIFKIIFAYVDFLIFLQRHKLPLLEKEKMFMFSNEVQDPGAEEDKTVGWGIPEDMPGVHRGRV